MNTFLGETFQPERDKVRLNKQFLAVRTLMLDGQYRTLADISFATGAPEASASARLRDLRRNGYMVDRRYIRRGLFEYKVVAPFQPAQLTLAVAC